jgi:hypothetical protein
MTNEEIARLIALAEDASAGPWPRGGLFVRSFGGRASYTLAAGYSPGPHPDAEFIAAAREAVPALCQALLTAREDLSSFKAQTGELCDRLMRERDAAREDLQRARALLRGAADELRYAACHCSGGFRCTPCKSRDEILVALGEG